MDTLLRYETERQRHTVPFLLAIEGLVAMYRLNYTPVVMARSVGLKLLDCIPALKVRLFSIIDFGYLLSHV